MGTDNERTPILMINGQHYEGFVTLDTGLLEPADFNFLDSAPWYINGGTTAFTVSHLKRISRKRTVKLLMGKHRFSRNTADAIARTWNGYFALHYIQFAITGYIGIPQII